MPKVRSLGTGKRGRPTPGDARATPPTVRLDRFARGCKMKYDISLRQRGRAGPWLGGNPRGGQRVESRCGGESDCWQS
jgi:hypothetical protein